MASIPRDEGQPESWPDDGDKFAKGFFLVGMPVSLLLWWAIVAFASALA